MREDGIEVEDEGDIAIVGVSCRLPGSPDPAAFWRLLTEGAHAIAETPPDRWDASALYDEDPSAKGRLNSRLGGYLEGIDRFDPAFFGISPREAAVMDPQQRLMLELSWEALEDAGIVPDSLRGSRTGVFTGASSADYEVLVHRNGLSAITQHTATGLNRGVISNRVSHALGLHGPSLTVDSAQSSSLVAVHLACESLRRGESTSAIAGGVNLNLTPEGSVAFAKFGALSPDGRCYAFDARANGTVLGEGGGAVVLKPLSRALADGDFVYCVIRGSAVNHDGADGGLTSPNPLAQAENLRQAYQRAGVAPAEVQYVELHGTGTKVGDPVEAAALGAVLGAGRTPDSPLVVGSVKTNIGHLAAAAGIAGLLKTVLAIRHRRIPPSLNFESPNPLIALDEWNLRVQQGFGEWPDAERSLVAGVSAFGMGGTNCHVVLAEPPNQDTATADDRAAEGPVPWLVSARTEAALRAQAARLAGHLAEAETTGPLDVGYSLAATRSSFEYRAVLLGENRGELMSGLTALAEGRRVPGTVRGVPGVPGERGGLAFLFAGQGSQRPAMGRELAAVFPRFAAELDAVCAQFDAHLDRPLRDLLFADEGSAEAELLGQTAFTQPALFAVEVALYRLIEGWGVKPDYLAGHSIGELAAAHVAGVLTLADATALVAARGQLMQELPAGGAMMSLEAAEADVLPLLRGRQGRVGIAAVNGPAATVISGDEDAVLEVAAVVAGRGGKTKRIRVSHAFHSPHMDAMLDEFRAVASRLSFHPPRIPLVSNVTGELLDAEQVCDPEYWVRHVRQPVRFLDGVRLLEREGVAAFLEIGPGGVLSGMGRDCLSEDAEDIVLIPALRGDRSESKTLLGALAQLHVRGVRVDWPGFFADRGGRRIALPTYAFQRERYWVQPRDPGTGADHGGGIDLPGETVPGVHPEVDAPQSPGELSEADRRAGLLELVRVKAAEVLEYSDPAAIDVHRAFRDLGFDSLTAVELRTELAAATGLRLPTTLLFDHPTPIAVAAYLDGELSGLGEPVAPVAAGGPATDEPIAIVAMGCRLPGGADSPEALWDLVSGGLDVVGDFPPDRGWGTSGSDVPYARVGGFLDDAAGFDAGFFGISPREALPMDPQQRLLLETSWEVFERAGIDVRSLRGSDTGVFVGSGYSAYGRGARGTDEVADDLLTSSAASVISGRISYVFGFEGPAVTVDTACSSSLVALHLAVRSLRSGECSLVLAGGATVMANPEIFEQFARQQGLAADGRCKPFAAAADGTGWSEGLGLVLLERLSDARRNEHEVLAVVRGSAVNQDGASNGLTAPNGPSQQRVIRRALANAGVSAAEVDAVEAHGTGTRLGDPIEAQALLATYGRDRLADRPLWLGSLKSNIGHTQAAAGIAGVIKMVQAMRHGVLPQSLHIDEPSPHVDWSAGAVELLSESQPWPEVDRPRRAGVSSFGVSGTNAHVILEQAPETAPVERDATREPGPVPWVLSAKSEAALREQARRLGEYVRCDEDVPLVDVAYSLATTRAGLERRVAVVGSGRDDLLSGLDAVARGESPIGVAEGSGDVVFVFPGQGSQWAGMAVGLLESSPVFAERISECAAALSGFVDWSLLDVLRGVEGAASLERVDVVQPVLWAVMVSLAEVWRAHGVHPAAVVGHSQGEIAAACVAGALSLEDAAKVVALRSQAIRALSGQGGMVSIAESVQAVRERLAAWDGKVSVAAVNGPNSVVVSGTVDALDELISMCEAQGVRARRIPVDYASHSSQVERIHDDIRDALGSITPTASAIAFYSTVAGERIDTDALDAEYWYRNLRQTVEFEATVRTLLTRGYRVFIEVSAHPVVTMGVQETIDDAGLPAAAIGTLRRDEGGPERFTASLGEAFAHGAAVDWQAFFAGTGARRVDLPTYAFQRRRYWLEPDAGSGAPHSAQDPDESGFWTAVEREDAEGVAATLALDDDSRSSLAALLPSLSSWRRQSRRKSVVDRWRYRVVWKPLGAMSAAPPSGRWLVAVPDGFQQDAWVAKVAERFGGSRLVVSASERPEAISERLRKVLTEQGPVAGVVSVLAVDERALADHDAVPGGLAATVSLIQALTAVGCDARVWSLTRGAVSVGPSDGVAAPVQAMVWGLGRVVALEHPDRWGGLVDLPQDADDATIARLAAVLAGSEDQVAVRASGVFGRRLTRAEPTAAAVTGRWSAPDSVLITGGTGALGSRVARWLAECGVRQLILTSRRGDRSPDARELVGELTALGARVTLVACDVSDRDAVADLLARHPVTGIVHAAGVLDDGVVESLDPARVDAVLRAKATAALNLHELTRDRELDMFVLFSSTSAVLGASGLGNYAPGNAFLDALAEHRQANGLAATSIAWGPWAGGGMAAGPVGEVYRRHGMPEMDPDSALAALHRALHEDETALVVADIEWERFLTAFTATRPSPLLADLPEAGRLARNVESARNDAAFADRLAGLPAAEQGRILLDVVRTQAAVVLGHSGPGQVEPQRALKEAGLDSVTAVEFRNRLAAVTGLRLPATLVYDSPTPASVAQRLRDELLGADAPTAAPAAAGSSDEPVAIVGMACRFPGGVRSPEDLWQLLTEEIDAISGFPADRGWDLEALYDPDPDGNGTSYTREGGFLYDAAEFDAGFFGISPREALAMDPQQRLLLETAWEVLERAGIDPRSLRGSATGVFAGSSGQDYVRLLSAGSEAFAGHVITGNASSVISGRASYVFGFDGPAVTVDTACSSSLVALHLAAQSLRQGECSLALAGGVMVMSTPSIFTEFSRQRGLAPDGRCKPFAASADGAGFSEGAGLLLLERLSDARRNGHQVLAVVRGSAVNQDGASNGLSAPNGPAQQRVIRQALANAGLSTGDVDAVEAHGTGTTLGDPIEAQALLATYGRTRERPLWLGSVKSNIGHTQAAAGVAGVIKMVLAMRHGVLPRSLHIDEPSAHVDWSAGAVELLAEPHAWPEVDRPRRAGVSSFGISGTNAHVILEQAPDDAAIRPGGTANLATTAPPWVLSAKSDAALRAEALELRAYLERHPELDLVDAATTLATSRAGLAERAVILGADRDGLSRGLAALADGEGAPGVLRGADLGDGKVAFVFPGQGSQWAGMALELMESSPVFAERLAECAAALSEYVDWSLLDVLRGAPDAPALDRVDVVQPALFAVMVSLAGLWRACGVEPDAVVGHSQGEIAAACVAGALSLADAAKVVALRSRALRILSGRGAMMSVSLPLDEVRTRLGNRPAGLSVAAVNGPESLVVSGDAAAVDELFAALTEEGVQVRKIQVDYASHSAHVDEIRAELVELLGAIEPRPADVPFLSTVTGDWLDTTELDADYWFRNLRHTVELEKATRALTDSGFRIFVETSPHPVLTVGIRQTLEAQRVEGAVVGSLRRGEGGAQRFFGALAEAHVHGVPVDWNATFAGGPRSLVDLPTYAFQRERYWPQAEAVGPAAAAFADDLLWETVEQQDLDSLRAMLRVDDDALDTVLPALRSWRQRTQEASVLDSWRYQVVWRPAVTATAHGPAGTWLVLVPAGLEDGEPVTATLAALDRHGVRTVPVVVDTADLDRAQLAELLGAALESEPVAGVLSLLALAEGRRRDHRVELGLAATLLAVQALVGSGTTARLWCVTRGAVATDAADRLLHPTQAQVWGLGRVAALEHPDVWGGLIDLPPVLDEQAGRRLVGVLAGETTEDEVAVRASGVFARRLVHAPSRGEDEQAEWRPRGTVLITGGTGALGGYVARSLARGGAEHLVLTSRGGPDAPGAQALRAALEELGSRVAIVSCDVADRAALAKLLDGLPGLRTVVHAAGVVDMDPLATTGVADLAEVLAAKVDGASNLDELLADRELDAFVLFSSNAGVWGSGGQGAYAAANAYLDALARRRRDRGRAATSVAWGAWGESGMAAETAVREGLSRRGVLPMRPELAVRALHRAVAQDEAFVAVADVEWERFVPGYTMARRRPLLAELPEAVRILAADTASRAPDAGAVTLAGRLAELPGEEQEELLLHLVRTNVATALGHRGHGSVDPGKAFKDQGFDSLTAVDLRNRLNTETGLRLPMTIVFDHPTPAALARHLWGELVGGARPESELDRLEDVVTAMARDDGRRAVAKARLEAMLRKLTGDDEEPDAMSAAQVLRSASDEEVFDFIDRELG